MKLQLVPDIHGRPFWESVDVKHNDYVVFLGDYFDPYPDDDTSMYDNDMITNFCKILALKEANMKKVVLLLGNHDYSAIKNTKEYYCSRHDYKNAQALHELLKEHENLFNIAFSVVDNDKTYLFTHAGLHQGWLEQNELKVEGQVAEWLQKIYDNDPSLFWQISGWRGGIDSNGSPIWADVREYWDYALPYIQYFGHTRLEKDYLSEKINCIDTRKIFDLTI